MSDRIVTLYEATIGDQAKTTILDELARGGVHLANPQTGLVTLLSDLGDIPVSFATAQERLSSDNGLHATWWVNGEPIYGSIRSERGVWIVHFSMGGWPYSLQDAVRDLLVDRLYHPNRFGIGLVFDPDQATFNYLWGRFFIEHETLDWSHAPIGFPDLLIVRQRDLVRLLNLPSNVDVRTESNSGGDFAILVPM